MWCFAAPLERYPWVSQHYRDKIRITIKTRRTLTRAAPARVVCFLHFDLIWYGFTMSTCKLIARKLVRSVKGGVFGLN